MTINNLEKFIANLWDWGILNGCFGNTRIRPTDIDGLVEKNGRFLILEAKSPNVEITLGQAIMFQRLVETGYFSIILIWGEVNKPQKIQVITKQKSTKYDTANIEILRELVSSWYVWARSHRGVN